jgi:maleylpyruvate isomerase
VSAETPDHEIAAAIQATDTVDVDQVRRDIEGMAASERSLTDFLLGLDPVEASTPSLLPGWSVGQVLTHIARNADSVLRLLSGLGQYWMGAASRNADIELGATRAWHELVDDVVATSAAVTARMGEVDHWTGTVQTVTAVRPKATLPAVRRREVEIHRVDLGLGYGFADTPADYLRGELRALTMTWAARQPMGMTTLPAEVMALPEPDRLAWLTGRLDLPGVEPARIY